MEPTTLQRKHTAVDAHPETKSNLRHFSTAILHVLLDQCGPVTNSIPLFAHENSYMPQGSPLYTVQVYSLHATEAALLTRLIILAPEI